MILAILQARMTSTRLPGKVMRPLLGKPMLARQIERIKRANLIDRLIIATSEHASDDCIATLAAETGISCYRGALDDVLDRFYQAAKTFTPLHVVRLTGDCPLADPALIDRVIEHHLHGHYDYTSNTIEPTFPDGLDVEVFTFSSLATAWENAKTPSAREHVTLFIYSTPERYRIGSYKSPNDLSSLRWTVDEPADFILVQFIYQSLYPTKPAFTTSDVIDLLEQQPELKTMNTNHRRNEGLLRSLANETGGQPPGAGNP
jgi:spore coat polysaccharide biosynthesis protein SpsF